MKLEEDTKQIEKDIDATIDKLFTQLRLAFDVNQTYEECFTINKLETIWKKTIEFQEWAAQELVEKNPVMALDRAMFCMKELFGDGPFKNLE